MVPVSFDFNTRPFPDRQFYGKLRLMWLPTRNQTLVALIVGVPAFFVGGAIATDHSVFGQGVAAWVQAVGSIAALYFAGRQIREAGKTTERQILVARTESTNSHIRTQIAELQRESGQIDMVIHLVDLLGKACQEASHRLEGKNLEPFPIDNFAFVEQALLTIPLHSLPHGTIAIELLNARNLATDFMRHFDSWQTAVMGTDDRTTKITGDLKITQGPLLERSHIEAMKPGLAVAAMGDMYREVAKVHKSLCAARNDRALATEKLNAQIA
jgi:hypothetical protein